MDHTHAPVSAVAMEQSNRLVDVWVDINNDFVFNQNDFPILPSLTHELVSETLAPLENSAISPLKVQHLSGGQAVRQVVSVGQTLDKGVQIDQHEDELIRLLRQAKEAEQVKEWEFIEYSSQELANWQRDYQAQIWAVDRCIMGITDDPSFHTFKMPRVKVPPAPMSVRDALRDRILNNGKNLPENALLSDLRERALGQGVSEKLQTWPQGLSHLTKRGTPRLRPHRNYVKLIERLNKKTLRDEQ